MTKINKAQLKRRNNLEEIADSVYYLHPLTYRATKDIYSAQLENAQLDHEMEKRYAR
jgi:hypothetical protein